MMFWAVLLLLLVCGTVAVGMLVELIDEAVAQSRSPRPRRPLAGCHERGNG